MLKNAFRSLALLLGLTLIAACGRQSPGPDAAAGSGAAKTPTAAGQASAAKIPKDPMIVEGSPDILARLKLAAVGTTTMADTIRIAGKLDVNQYRTSRIGAPITGRLVQVDALFGQQVKQGQVLAEINSPDLGQAQLGFLRATSQMQLLGRAVERAQLLLAADVIGSAELQRRQAELTIATAEKRAAGDQLKALGLTAKRIATLEQTGQIQASAPITSPLNGTVIERKVVQGEVVNPADALFVVSDLSSLWALAEVPEQDARFVQTGHRVTIEIPALDQDRIIGKVAYVADVVNPETRTVRVGVVLDNPERKLKPAMLITMLIEGRSVERQVIPNGAIVRENDRDHVFIELPGNRFRLVPAELGPERGGTRALLKPLDGAPRIVIEGSFHLNNIRAQRAVEGR